MAGVQTAWGLDVGITSLKAMKLSKDGDKVVLDAFDVVEHETFLSESDIDKDEIIRSTLRKFLDRNPIRREALYIGVPGSSTFARFVKLPPVDPKKIPEIVRFEAIQQIPFPLDQVNWDYQTFTNADSPDVEVGIFAMKKELVGQVLANFRALGLTVHGVQMSPLAVYNAATYDGLTEGKGAVIIDMGAEHTDLVIMDQGRLWLRTINIGGNHFTDAVSKSFKQPFNRAEQLKKTAATSKYQKQIFQAMRPIFADLVGEIQRSLGYYNSSHRDSRLERIIGMGNPFRLPNLQKYLQQELKMDVVRLDTFRKVTADGRLAPGLAENILPMSASYGLAIQALGLAPLDTNLLPLEIARQMLWKRKRPWFYGTAAAVIAGVGFLGYQYHVEAARFNSFDATAARAKNEDALYQAGRQKDEYGKQSSSIFEANKARAATYLGVTTYRMVWPSIQRDMMDALPQPKVKATTATVAAPAVAIPPSIVLLSIEPQFTTSLSLSQGTDVVQPVGRPPTAPVSTATVSTAPDDKGFVLTIKGYTVNSDSSAQYGMPGEYARRLAEMAPKEGKGKDGVERPYWFEMIRDGTKGDPDVTASPWGGSGSSRGSWWGEFAEDIAGIALPNRPQSPVGGGTRQITDLSDADIFQPTGEKPPSMKSNFRFILTVKVHMKDSLVKDTLGK